MIGSRSYPINGENRKKAKAALKWLTDREREGQTWIQVDNKYKTKSDKDVNEIVFVYPSVLPSVQVKFANIFGVTSAIESTASERKFENIAKEVANTFSGLPSKEKPENIRIFSLRQIKPALSKRAKVIYSRNYTPEHLFESAYAWQAGCENIPDTYLRVWEEKKKNEDSDSQEKGKAKSPVNLEQKTPMPLQVARIANKIWKITGESAGETKRMQYYEGIELLLENESDELLNSILHTVLSHTQGLFFYMGNLLHSGRVLPSNISSDVCSILPILGLLLYKHNKTTKDIYMKNTPYLIGQILKISDELHSHYCNVVRNGDVPPVLAGASVFVSATETPCQALAQLCQRVKPYIDWAKQYRTKDIKEKDKESWKAGWYLNLYEDAVTKLQLESAARFNDFEKAQVFIGYLAAFPKREKVESSPSSANPQESTSSNCEAAA